MSTTLQASAIDTFSVVTSKDQATTTLRKTTELTGRVLLMSLFLLSGVGKVSGYAATAAYMSSVGVPAALLPWAIALEILGAIAIILGWQTRAVALLLAGFTLATGVLFHNQFADQMHLVMFLKNLSITGAFLMLAANGAGPFSLDARKAK